MKITDADIMTAGMVIAGIFAFLCPLILVKAIIFSAGVAMGIISLIALLDYLENGDNQMAEWVVAWGVLSAGMCYAAWWV